VYCTYVLISANCSFCLVLSVICVLVLEAALLSGINPSTPSDAYTALHRVGFKFPYDTAYALANYGCFCTAQLGFFPATAKFYLWFCPKI